MKIIIDAENAVASLKNPGVLFAGSEVPFTIEGAEGIDAETLWIWIYSVKGGPLAFLEGATVNDGVISGTLSTKFKAVSDLFAGRRIDERIPVTITIYDINRLWACSTVEMCNRPDMTDITAPIPEVEYVTKGDLAALGNLDPDSPQEEIIEKVNEIINA